MLLYEGPAPATILKILARIELFSGKENNKPLKNKNMKGSEPSKPVSVLVPQNQLTT